MSRLVEAEWLEAESVAPAELRATVPNWRAGDTIHLGTRTLRVVALRDVDGDAPPALVVEQMT